MVLGRCGGLGEVWRSWGGVVILGMCGGLGDVWWSWGGVVVLGRCGGLGDMWWSRTPQIQTFFFTFDLNICAKLKPYSKITPAYQSGVQMGSISEKYGGKFSLTLSL